jgi:oligopeptide/dipeptide ABC transporter ATP-binding protein
MSDVLEVSNLTKRFRGRGITVSVRNEFTAVDTVSFTITKNSIFGLVGESGSGKTTVARSILYLDPPSEGDVSFEGISLSNLSPKQLRSYRRKMQIIFQDPNAALNPKLTINRSMEEGLKNRNIQKQERDEKIDDMLNLVGITPAHKNRYPHEFSGGQKQRIVIARALVMDPDFIILDEPVSNLDVSIQAQIINLLLDLKKRFSLTYLFISHDLNLISYLSDTIAVMYAGRIVEFAPAETIISRPGHPYTVHLFSSVPGAGDKKEESGEINQDIRRNTVTGGCPYYTNCPQRIDSCTKAVPELVSFGKDHYIACIRAENNIKEE